MEDDDLCECLERGEEQAFHALFRRHHSHMVRLARAFVADRAAAEEIAQDTWLAVWTGIGGFERRSSLKSWIYAILVNKARTRAGRDQRTIYLPDVAREGASACGRSVTIRCAGPLGGSAAAVARSES